MDNEETAENRCQEVKCLNLMRLLKIDMIKKHLLAYDYHAALAVGKEIKEDLSPVAYQWLETAAARSLCRKIMGLLLQYAEKMKRKSCLNICWLWI